MARRTPPIYAKGRYTLTMPWQADPAKIYTCQAIRSFSDLVELEIDPFTEFYEPMGVDASAYEADRQQRATIVTLTAENSDEVIYVPDTYIESFPNMDNIEYSHIVLSVSLSAVPDYLDLSFLKDQIANVVLDVIGLNATVKENRVPHVGSISTLDHDTLETARLANVKLQETDHARAKRLQAKLDDLQVKYDNLVQIMRDNGTIQ